MTTRAWAHAIVRRYPQAWRQRYETEVRGLIDDSSIHFRDLGELLRGLLTERARELLTSAENPGRTARIVEFAAPIAGVLFIAVAWVMSYGIGKLTEPWPDPVQYVALGVFATLMVVGFVIAIRGSKRWNPNLPLIMPPDVAMMLLPLIFVEAVLYGAITHAVEPSRSSIVPAWIVQSSNWLFVALAAGNQIASFFPGHELLQAFARMSAAEEQIRMNEKWVEGCRDMISKGVPSPLNDALTQVGKWTVERDSARARLKELGYEARFRGSIDPRESARETAT